MRFTRERAREGNPLTLTARELPRPGAREIRDPDAFEQVGAVALAGEVNVGSDGEVREQPVILREVADSPPLGAEVDPSIGVEPQLIAKRNPSSAWTFQAGDSFQQRGLTRAGWSDQRDGLSVEGQCGANLEASSREGDVDVEEIHERSTSFEASRIAALTIMSSTPIEIA